MYVKIQILFWRWTLYIPLKVARSIRTPLGCTIAARLLLLLLGIFCVYVPPVWLANENLQAKYKGGEATYIGLILHYIGLVMVVIALLSLLLSAVAIFRRIRSNP